MRFRTIQIDFDVHKLIEAARTGFDETDNDVIRRLLGLGTSHPSDAAQGAPWERDGLHLPHGTPLRMKHLRGAQVYEGAVRNGKLVLQGHAFDTPSSAAGALAVTRKGGRTNLNGWEKIEAKLDGQSGWKALSVLKLGDRPRINLSDLVLEL